MSRTLLSRAESSESTGNAAAGEDPQWSKLCDKLAKYMRNLNRHTGTLRKARERLEERQARDVENAKSKLEDVMEKSRADVSLIHDTLSNLAKRMRANPGLKGHTLKIAEEAKEGIREYEDAHRKLLLLIKRFGGTGAGPNGQVTSSSSSSSSARPSLSKRQPPRDRDDEQDDDDEDDPPRDHRRAAQEDRLARFRFSSHGVGAKKAPLSKRFAAANEGAASDDDDNDDHESADSKGLLSQQQQQLQQQQTAADEFDQQLHDEIMAERKKEVQEIAENLADINEIFGHINQLVGEQGEQLDVVEENVEHAVVKMEKGNEELQAARRTIQKSNRRSLWLALGFVILLAILVVLVTRFT